MLGELGRRVKETESPMAIRMLKPSKNFERRSNSETLLKTSKQPHKFNRSLHLKGSLVLLSFCGGSIVIVKSSCQKPVNYFSDALTPVNRFT
mmetsp:Transcript_24793/g.43673  ORF Transcript_24793/g.43673 Transcript_24793/m.43673 type:complete len:92 (+) Transcript_24793:271-546(+)